MGKEILPSKKFVDKNNKYLVTIPDGLLDEDKLGKSHNVDNKEVVFMTKIQCKSCKNKKKSLFCDLFV